MTRKQRIAKVGFGMAGSGAVLVVISMLVEKSYWFLLVGMVFVVLGAVMYFGSRLAS